jgi:hypothetical protein
MADPSPQPSLFTRIIPLLILAAVVTLFFAPALFFGKVYFFRDLCMEIVPKRQFWADHHGLVLWNPYVFAGEPYAANPQSSAFYPLSLLWLFGPAEVMLGPYLALHFLIAGVLAYFLFLETGLSRTSALAGAFALILGGGFASLQLQVVNLNSAVWIPGIFWMGIRAAKVATLRPSLLLGGFIALQILGGEPEICYLTLLTLVAYLLIRVPRAKPSLPVHWQAQGASPVAPKVRVDNSLQDHHRAPTSGPTGWMKFGGRLMLALGLALGLSAIQWVLTLEMTGLSNRAAGFSLAEASAYSLEARDLISLLVPHVFLDPNSKEWGFGFWAQRLPFFLSIYPGVIVLLLLPMAFRSGRRREAIFWTALAVISLWLALGPEGHLYSLAYRWLPGFDRFRFPERALIIFALALAWLAALGLQAWSEPVLIFGFLTTSPRLRRFIPKVWVMLLVMNLFLAHRLLNPTTDRAFYTSTPAWAQELKSSTSPLPDRVYIAPPPKLPDQFLRRDQAPLDFYRLQREGLQPFFALPYGIPDLGAYSSFRLARYDEMHSLLAQADPGRRDRLLALSGIAKLAIPGQGIRQLASPLPRAYLAFAERRVENHAQALRLLLDWKFDPGKEVILEGETIFPRLSGDKPISAVEVKRYENERVEIATDADQPGWLVLSDTYYPGWQARVDEKPVPILQANAFFRAVLVPEGRHQVRFEYRPSHWRLAWGLTAGAALLAGLLMIVPGRIRKENSR